MHGKLCFWNFHISKNVSAKFLTKIPRATTKKAAITESGRMWNDCGDSKYCTSSQAQYSVAGAPVAAILNSFESSFSSVNFSATWKERRHLGRTLLRASPTCKNRPLVGKPGAHGLALSCYWSMRLPPLWFHHSSSFHALYCVSCAPWASCSRKHRVV